MGRLNSRCTKFVETSLEFDSQSKCHLNANAAGFFPLTLVNTENTLVKLDLTCKLGSQCVQTEK